jgi:hypothetical protein
MLTVDGVKYYTLDEARRIIYKEQDEREERMAKVRHEIYHAEGNLNDFGGNGCIDCGLSWAEQLALGGKYGNYDLEGNWKPMREQHGY